MKRYFIIVSLIAFVTGSVITIGYASYRYVYNNFIKSNNSVVSVFNEDEMELVIEDKVVSTKVPPEIVDGEILIPIDVVREYFDPHINLDEETDKVTITTKD